MTLWQDWCRQKKQACMHDTLATCYCQSSLIQRSRHRGIEELLVGILHSMLLTCQRIA
jgi:hypothetical protein